MADIAITAANVKGSSTATRRKEYTFGATVTQGQVVYLNASNQWVLADQNAAVTGNGVNDMRGIAECAGSLNQPACVVTQDTSFTVGGTLVNGTTYYLSDTAGGITATLPTTGDYPVSLGIANSTTTLVLNTTATGVII